MLVYYVIMDYNKKSSEQIKQALTLYLYKNH